MNSVQVTFESLDVRQHITRAHNQQANDLIAACQSEWWESLMSLSLTGLLMQKRKVDDSETRAAGEVSMTESLSGCKTSYVQKAATRLNVGLVRYLKNIGLKPLNHTDVIKQYKVE